MVTDFAKVIARLRKQGSDDAQVEVKASATKLSADVWESVSAFANTDGGLLVLGLAEKDGFTPVEGFALDTVLDQFVEGIGSGGKDGARLTNPPSFGIARETLDDYPVLTITVAPNPPGTLPCFVTARGLQRGSYKRVDDKDIRLSTTEIFEMQHLLVASDADHRVVAGAEAGDLDPDVLDALIARRKGSRVFYGTTTREDRLVRLNILDKSRGVLLAGLLTAGMYPQQFFPRLLIDVTAHQGNEKATSTAGTRFLDRSECDGRLVDSVDDAVHAVMKNLHTRSVVQGALRHDVPEIPVAVIREAIANAVLHREYSDMFCGQPVSVDVYANRLEITSPGGLWGGKTQANIADGTSRCRNQVLLRLMQHIAPHDTEAFTVEGQGGGVRMMMAAMKENRLKPPEFVVGPDQVKVILRRQGAERPGQRREQTFAPHGNVTAAPPNAARPNADSIILEGLAGKDPQNIHAIVEWSGLGLRTVRNHLRRLVDNGSVHATAPSQSKNRRYVLAVSGARVRR